MTKIYNDLYQFTEYMEVANLSLHQYLVLTEESFLVHTGTIKYSEILISQLKEALGDRKLKYILVSHFESDECGGLSAILKEFPETITICSEVTARQLLGFGITYNLEIKKPGDILAGKDYNFEFVKYPSEVHLWDGLLFFETNRKILFSSDLVFSFGNIHGEIVERNWQEQLDSIGSDSMSSLSLREEMKNNLKTFKPQFIATGHGPCVKLI